MATAATYPVGTPIYAVDGYAATFRLGVPWPDGLEVYEVSDNPAARTGGDLLDVQTKIEWVSVDRTTREGAEAGRIFDRARIERLAALITAAPALAVPREASARDYIVTLRFTDGTGTVRTVDMKRRWLDPGVTVSDELLAILNSALSTGRP